MAVILQGEAVRDYVRLVSNQHLRLHESKDDAFFQKCLLVTERSDAASHYLLLWLDCNVAHILEHDISCSDGWKIFFDHALAQLKATDTISVSKIRLSVDISETKLSDCLASLEFYRKTSYVIWELGSAVKSFLHALSEPCCMRNAQQVFRFQYVLADIYGLCYDESYGLCNNFALTLREAEELASRYGTENIYFVLDDDKPIAFSILAATQRQGEIVELGVLPEYRRKGIGRALAMFSLEQLRKQQAGRIIVEVIEDNVSANMFWKSLGFRKTIDQTDIWDLDV